MRLGPSHAPPPAPAAGGDRGLTLVEVVVALLVLSAGLLAVAGMTTALGRQTRGAAARTDQTLLAQSRLGAVLAGGWAASPPGSDTDTIARGPREWVVTTQVTQPGARRREVSLTVSRVDGTMSRTFTVSLARPNPLPDP